MERATYTTKSFLIALALVRGKIDVEQAAQAAHVEVNSQIEKWGEVEDCKQIQLRRITLTNTSIFSSRCRLSRYPKTTGERCVYRIIVQL